MHIIYVAYLPRHVNDVKRNKTLGHFTNFLLIKPIIFLRTVKYRVKDCENTEIFKIFKKKIFRCFKSIYTSKFRARHFYTKYPDDSESLKR